MKNWIKPVSAMALASAFLALPMASHALAQVSIEERLQFLKDQSGCGADIAQFCSGMKAGSGRLYRCLDENRARLTKSCINVMPEAESLLRQAGVPVGMTKVTGGMGGKAEASSKAGVPDSAKKVPFAK